jgi:hypothetical protein
VQNNKCWMSERTHAWMNGDGMLRRCTDRDSKTVDFYRYLAGAFVTVRCLHPRSRTRYRWTARHTTHRLK